jgi:hypothetical protein
VLRRHVERLEAVEVVLDLGSADAQSGLDAGRTSWRSKPMRSMSTKGILFITKFFSSCRPLPATKSEYRTRKSKGVTENANSKKREKSFTTKTRNNENTKSFYFFRGFVLWCFRD